MMRVNEIFYSLQGEGIDVGRPTIFVRLTGCNLRCRYCDTTYAFYEGEDMGMEEIIEAIKKWKCRRVCITGGEPLLQQEVYALIDALLKMEYEVSVETNGSIGIEKLAERDVRIKMDYKLPSSGMMERMKEENFEFLRQQDELKFIIGDRNDYEHALKILDNHAPVCNIIMQPIWGEMDAKKLAEWILEDGMDVMLSIQLHKILWGNERGR